MPFPRVVQQTKGDHVCKVPTRLEGMSNVTRSQWIDKIGCDGCMHVIFSIEWVVF